MRFASDVEIVLAYNAEWRGFANYYAIADDVKRKLNKAGYFALLSCVKTIAGKHRTSARRVFAKLRRGTDFYISYEVGDTTRTIKLWQLKDLQRHTRTWGGIDIPSSAKFVFSRTELVERLNARECERCGSNDQPCEVHHVRRIGELQHAGFSRHMAAARQRKRMVLCSRCHNDVHAGQPTDRQRRTARSRGEPNALKGARSVRRGA